MKASIHLDGIEFRILNDGKDVSFQVTSGEPVYLSSSATTVLASMLMLAAEDAEKGDGV